MGRGNADADPTHVLCHIFAFNVSRGVARPSAAHHHLHLDHGLRSGHALTDPPPPAAATATAPQQKNGRKKTCQR